MSKQYVEIYYKDALQETAQSISSYSINADYTVYVLTDGTAALTTVLSGGKLIVSGGTATGTTVKGGSTGTAGMAVNSGMVQDVTVRNNGILTLNAAASGINAQSGSTLDIASGGEASSVRLYHGCIVTVFAGGVIRDSTQNSGTLVLSGGTAYNMTLKFGGLTVGDGAYASGIVQDVNGSVIEVLSGGTLNGLTCKGAVATIAGGGIASNSKLTSYKAVGFEEELFCASVTLSSGAIHKGTLNIDSKSTLTAEAGSTIDFTVSACTPGGTALINDFSRISGSPSFTITVRNDQPIGTYNLAGGVSSFGSTVTIKNEAGVQYGTLSVGNNLALSDYTYSMNVASGILSLSITATQYSPYNLVGSAGGITWESTYSDFVGQYSFDNFGTVLSVETSSKGIDTYAMPAGTYQWRVAVAGSASWAQGNDIAAAYVPDPQTSMEWVSNADGKTDLFFANANGTWSKRYFASHAGSVGDWNGTGEQVALAGKNKLTDIFSGSTDANILVMTDDSCGDALFLDDIYSAFPAAEQGARIANLDEIRAGAGDDVVDMTSQRFAYAGDGVTVRGGSGNDTIWANKGCNLLLGDSGSDRLAGASGDDVLAGGSGDDSMHGGGGSDIFCFCENWGSDTIQQTSSGTVTLWFKDAVELTFTTVGNDTKITSAQGTILAEGLMLSSDNCRFGATGYEDEFAKLSAAGAFDAESSTYIFAEEK